MTYQYLQRHSLLRIALCFFMACLCCFGFFAPPIVTAHALIATSTIIMVTGSLLAAVGITFAAVDALNRGSTTFYNWCSSKATDVSRFIQEQAAKINLGSKAAMTIPVVIFLQLKMQAAMCFSKTQTSVPDTSGVSSYPYNSLIGSPLSDCLKVDTFRPPPGYVLNVLSSGSPNVGVTGIMINTIDRVGSNSYASLPNEVLRFTGRNGVTYDYRLHVILTSGSLIVELSENNKYKSHYAIPISSAVTGVKSILFDSDFFGNSREGVGFDATLEIFLYEGEKIVRVYSPGTLSVKTSNSSLGVECTFTGNVDGRTGAVYIPQVAYTPDVSIVGNPAWDDALAKERERNPDFVGPDISIPASETDLIKAHWEDMLANQAELTDALRDAIAALEEAGAGTGEGTISGTVEIAIGDVTIPSLAAPSGIVSLFPFCIPFDIARGLEALQAPPKEPHFEIPLKYGDIMDETIVLDLSWLDYIIRFIRWAELFLWSLGLAVVTRNYIKW